MSEFFKDQRLTIAHSSEQNSIPGPISSTWRESRRYARSKNTVLSSKLGLEFLSEQFALIRKRLKRQFLHYLGYAESKKTIDKDFTYVSAGLHLLWGALSPEVRSLPGFQVLFLEEERKLEALAAEIGGTFASRDLRIRSSLMKIALLRSPSDLVTWSMHNDAFMEELKDRSTDGRKPFERAYFGEIFSKPSYSVSLDGELFPKAIENYIRMMPSLYKWAQRAIDKKSNQQLPLNQILDAIIDLKEHISGQLFGYAQLSGSEEKLELWNAQIESLDIPAFAKLSLFPPVLLSLNKRVFDPDDNSFAASSALLKAPAQYLRTFSDLRSAMDFIRNLQPDRLPLSFHIGNPAHLCTQPTQPYLVDWKDFPHWLEQAISGLEMSLEEVKLVLRGDDYWNNQNRHLTNAGRSETFYDNPEYRVDLKHSEALQLAIYRKLKSSGQLPESLSEEFKLWRKFAKRGVTEFTDTWARYLFSRAKKSESPVASNLITSLYASELIWDLALREELATSRTYAPDPVASEYSEKALRLTDRIYKAIEAKSQMSPSLRSERWLETSLLAILEPENSEVKDESLKWLKEELGALLGGDECDQAIDELLDLTAKSQLSRMTSFIKAVRIKFPEKSAERERVINDFAQKIRTRYRETLFLMDSSSEKRPSLQVGLTEALGFRALSQLFGEISLAPFSEKIEVLEFFLGKADDVPKLIQSGLSMIDFSRAELAKLSERLRLGDRASAGEVVKAFNEGLALTALREHVGPYRARRFFQALTDEARAVILDSLITGPSGILAREDGKNWIVDQLVPKGSPWRQLAVDLADGYREGLALHKNNHLKTQFISFILASTSKRSLGRLDHEFLKANSEEVFAGHLSEEARLLRSIFQANSALMKIGQKIHSANLLDPETNVALASLKENSGEVFRESQFSWLENAATCEGVCDRVQILESTGNASTKAVFKALVDEEPSVVLVVKPNAERRGDSSFAIIDHALRYAVGRGHDLLRPLIPIVRRARETFVREIDMNQERASAEKMAPLYQPDQSYGAGYRFLSPVPKPLPENSFRSDRVYMVKLIDTESFFDLDGLSQNEVAQASMEKETQILMKEEVAEVGSEQKKITFEKDRHEGNTLRVRDSELSDRYQTDRLLLAIDPGQLSSISFAMRDAIFNALVEIAAKRNNIITLEKASDSLSKIVQRDFLTSEASLLEVRGVIYKQLLANSSKNPVEELSSILAYLEAEGFTVKSEIFDYIDAILTNHTWTKYLDSSPLEDAITSKIKSLLLGKYPLASLSVSCVNFFRRQKR